MGRGSTVSHTQDGLVPVGRMGIRKIGESRMVPFLFISESCPVFETHSYEHLLSKHSFCCFSVLFHLLSEMDNSSLEVLGAITSCHISDIVVRNRAYNVQGSGFQLFPL